ncbi:hypothetical protein [Aurantiacibacter flavus]|uniref:Uncharacterized protein n=1 Tax=Aurantiacibacter flavus TaxID=3145232 RepID=A0ABV0D0D3_9SPHN
MMKTLEAAAAMVAVMAAAGSPARAQDEDYRAIVIIMRACSQIEDVAARVTCYDNNIAARTAPAARSAPRPAPVPAPAPAAAVASDFGAENLPEVRQAARESRGDDEIVRRVRRADEIEPGLYLLTLDDNSKWRFSESMGLSYFPPGARSEVRIERGALGSYRLYADGQRAVRVMRVR